MPQHSHTPGLKPSLAAIAEHVPYGFECRSCGGSAYNWITKCARYAEGGDSCCPDFREWARKAAAGEPTIEQRRAKSQSPLLPGEIEGKGEGRP